MQNPCWLENIDWIKILLRHQELQGWPPVIIKALGQGSICCCARKWPWLLIPACLFRDFGSDSEDLPGLSCLMSGLSPLLPVSETSVLHTLAIVSYMQVNICKTSGRKGSNGPPMYKISVLCHGYSSHNISAYVWQIWGNWKMPKRLWHFSSLQG